MRRLICFLITLFVFVGLAYADPWVKQQGLIEARGFKNSSCYEQMAERRCDATGAKVRCVLEVFPGTKGALFFEIDPIDAPLGRSKKTLDYGVFSFKLMQSQSDQRWIVKVIQVKRVPLSEWRARPLGEFSTKLVLCQDK